MFVQRLLLLAALLVLSGLFGNQSLAQLDTAAPFPEKLEGAIQPGFNTSNRRSIPPRGPSSIQAFDSSKNSKQANQGTQQQFRILEPIRSAPATVDDPKNGNQVDPFGTVMSFPRNDDDPTMKMGKAKIVVHPLQSANANRSTFMVENVGAIAAPPFSVEIVLPRGTQIANVFPRTIHSRPGIAEVDFPSLGVGKTSLIHLQTTGRNEADFVTRIHTAQIHADKFEAHTFGAKSWPSNLASKKQNGTSPFRQASTSRSSKTASSDVGDRKHSVLVRKQAPSTTLSDSSVMVSMKAQTTLRVGQQENFEIYLANSADQSVADIVVQLTLPKGIMVTQMDRQAWVNTDRRTVSWKLESLAAGKTQTIRYSVKPIIAGPQPLRVVVGASDRFEDMVETKCVVKD